jgi:serine protease AprX
LDTLTRSGRVWDLLPPAHEDDGRVWDSADSGLDRVPLASLPPLVTTRELTVRRRRKWTAIVAVLSLIVAGLLASGASNDRLDSGVDTHVAAGNAHVDPDSLPLGSMYHVVDQIGARNLWSQGITGQGVNVAVIDTGVAPVDGLAPDKVVAMVDLTDEAADPATRFVDTNGHGTSMAGIIAGAESGADPATSSEHGEQFLGVAPDAGIVSVKVSGRDGSTELENVIAGIDWTIANAERLDVRVINLSYDSGSPLSYREDPLTAALERAWNAGIVVVAIAGNDGNETAGVASPGVDPFVITVAAAEATEDGLRIADFSNSGDGVRNPDIAAPGAHIDSLRAPGSYADLNHADVGYVDEQLFRGSGTSQAAAVTAGAVALLLEANPDLTPDQTKALLTSTATPVEGATATTGRGLLQIDAAAAATVPASQQTWTPAASTPSFDVSNVPACTTTDCWGGAHWGGAHWGGAHWG